MKEPQATIQGQNLTVDATILLRMSEQIGQVSKGLEAVQKDMQEVKGDVKEIRQTQQDQAIANEQAHSELRREFNEGFSALGGKNAVAVAAKNTPPPGASEGRTDRVERWGKRVAALKDASLWFYGLGVLIAGAVYTWLSKKGSATGP